MIKNLVFLLEEYSAKELLTAILPKLLSEEITAFYMVFEGKQDLERRLVNRMKGWQKADSAFIILRDQDGGDCLRVKQKLIGLCQQANRPTFLVRIACHELESFYLGDLQAVERGMGVTGLARQQRTRKFKTPDLLSDPAEELVRLTRGKYQKISGSRAIAPHIDLAGNCSDSFNALVAGIRKLVW
ncbi:MAG: DUF4276 family protein [Magnetococcales bacterium]|nr:DUF4276 family protein [Magnetococcales bacterium]